MWRLGLRWGLFNIFISDLQPWAHGDSAELSADTECFRRVGNGGIGNTQQKGVSQCQVTGCDCGITVRPFGGVRARRGGAVVEGPAAPRSGRTLFRGHPVNPALAAGESEWSFTSIKMHVCFSEQSPANFT